jgi:hypothetical protein
MDDEFAPYERGLESLKRLFQQLMPTAGAPYNEAFLDFLNLEAQLRENIEKARLNGDGQDLLADRRRVVRELNRLALETFGLDFNSQCKPEKHGLAREGGQAPPEALLYIKRSHAISLVQAYSQSHSQLDRQLQERSSWLNTIGDLRSATEKDLLQNQTSPDSGYYIAELIAYVLIAISPNHTLLPDMILTLAQRGLLSKQRAMSYARLYDNPRDYNFVIQRIDDALLGRPPGTSPPAHVQEALNQLENETRTVSLRHRTQMVNRWISEQELRDGKEQQQIERNLWSELNDVLQSPIDEPTTEGIDLATMIVELPQLYHPPVMRLSEDVLERLGEMMIAWICHVDRPQQLLSPLLRAVVTFVQKRSANNRLAMPRVDLLDALSILAPALRYHFPAAAMLIPAAVDAVITALP